MSFKRLIPILLKVRTVLTVLLIPFSTNGNPAHLAHIWNAREFGARGNGAILETRRIQNAIDACAEAGGGVVLLPAGVHRSGTLFLRDGVTLRLASNAVLSASRDLADYPRLHPQVRSRTENYTERTLIYGEGLRNVGIDGEGKIDGNGEAFFGSQLERPYLIRLVSCKGVSVSGITLRDAAMWAQHYLACEDVSIDHVKVRSHRQMNNDGLDLDGCQGVKISNCDIISEDDAIVLKSTCAVPCRNVTISDCRLSSGNNALKLGTESSAGFQNISIQDCDIYDTRNSGLALEVVDGGKLDGVDVSNLSMKNVGAPIFIRLGNRGRGLPGGAKPGVGSVENIRIRNVVATGAGHIGCSITGLPEFPVRNVELENIRVTFRGGAGNSRLHERVAENASRYPEHSMFGVLPAYGFYCRHVENLSFKSVDVDCLRNDARPSLVCDDVFGLQLTKWQAQDRTGDPRDFRFVNVTEAQVDRAPYQAGDSPVPARKSASAIGKAG